MADITFITPPSAFLLDERVFPSLGILKVAASCEQTGMNVAHLDLAGVSNYEDVVTTYCNSERPATFAMTATTPQMPAATRILETIRQEAPNAKVIIGGPHVTLVNAAARLNHEGRAARALEQLTTTYDTIVCGDGEHAIRDAVAGDSPRIIDADDPKSPYWLTSQGFTDSPWPARHLIDMDSYSYAVEGERALHLVAQLGCPFECGFCGGRSSPMLRRIRTRTTDSVIAEMEDLHLRYGVRAMMLNDDELNVNRQMVPLMHAIRDLGHRYGFTWKLRGFVKAELFNEEQAEAMHAAGFRWLLCGFESAHLRILRNINKKATLVDNTRMLRIAHAAGLKVKALMSFGHPGESEETIMATRDWLVAERPDDFDCTVITTYPGTPYYDRATQQSDGTYVYEYAGDRLYSEDADFSREAQYYKGQPGAYRSFVWTDALTPERLVELRDAVETEVRARLGIPFYTSAAAIAYEHSMGQGLSERLLKNSKVRAAAGGL